VALQKKGLGQDFLLPELSVVSKRRTIGAGAFFPGSAKCLAESFSSVVARDVETENLHYKFSTLQQSIYS
jgi:hypothetical protein